MERTINDLINIVGNKNVLTSTWNKKPLQKVGDMGKVVP